VPTTQAICRQCGYRLNGLAAPRCPECGSAFDLSDPRTYAVANPAARRAADLSMAALGAVSAMLFVSVPWLACTRLHLTPPIWAAIWAGLSSLAVAVLCMLLRWRRILLTGLMLLPACMLVVIEAAPLHQWNSVLGVLAGTATGLGLGFALSHAGTGRGPSPPDG